MQSEREGMRRVLPCVLARVFGIIAAGNQAMKPVEEPIACAVGIASGAGLHQAGTVKSCFRVLHRRSAVEY